VNESAPQTAELRRYGPMGLLIRPSHIPPATLAARIRLRYHEQVREVVPGATTVLIEWRSIAACDNAMNEIVRLLGPPDFVSPSPDPPLICPVRFNGPDLSEVARLTGRSPAAVIELITSAHLEVAFCGFAPGFGYLTGLPQELHLPRRSTPRTRVEAGSMAIAAGYAAIYPTASPGGWHLLGSCDLRLWDIDADPPALMTPGRQVRFIALDDDGQGADPST
jgi:KipI family sensor histidine kinase inhibitor